MFWDKFCDFIDLVNSKLGYVLAFGTVVMLFITLFEVVSRYIFNSPTTWAWRVNSMIFSGTLILGGGYVLLIKAHVKLDVLYERVSPKLQRIFDLVTFPVFLVFMSIVVWQGWRMAASSIALKEHPLGFFQPPLYYNKIAFVVGSILLLLEGLAIFIRTVRHRPAEKHESAPQPAPLPGGEK